MPLCKDSHLGPIIYTRSNPNHSCTQSAGFTLSDETDRRDSLSKVFLFCFVLFCFFSLTLLHQWILSYFNLSANKSKCLIHLKENLKNECSTNNCAFCQSIKSVIKPGQVGIPSGVVSNVMPSQPFEQSCFSHPCGAHGESQSPLCFSLRLTSKVPRKT